MARPKIEKYAVITVKWHPRATAIAEHGSDSWGQGTLTPRAIRYQGNEWVVALSTAQNVLWVLCDDELTVLTNRAELLDLAEHIQRIGEVDQKGIDAELAKQRLANLSPKVVKPKPITPNARAALAGPVDKDEALHTLTVAAARAFVAGASPFEVRLAVLCGMGLDSDDLPE